MQLASHPFAVRLRMDRLQDTGWYGTGLCSSDDSR
jgi:hypothetical protein